MNDMNSVQDIINNPSTDAPTVDVLSEKQVRNYDFIFLTKIINLYCLLFQAPADETVIPEEYSPKDENVSNFFHYHIHQ